MSKLTKYTLIYFFLGIVFFFFGLWGLSFFYIFLDLPYNLGFPLGCIYATIMGLISLMGFCGITSCVKIAEDMIEKENNES